MSRYLLPLGVFATDQNGRTGIDWGAYGVPETIVADKAGLVRYKHIGPPTPEVLEGKLLPLVKELNNA